MRSALLFVILLAGCAAPAQTAPMLMPVGMIHNFVAQEPSNHEFLVPEGVAEITLVARFAPIRVGEACAPRLDDPPSIRIERPDRTNALFVQLIERVGTGDACELASKEVNVTASPGRWLIAFEGQGQALGSAGAS